MRSGFLGDSIPVLCNDVADCRFFAPLQACRHFVIDMPTGGNVTILRDAPKMPGVTFLHPAQAAYPGNPPYLTINPLAALSAPQSERSGWWL